MAMASTFRKLIALAVDKPRYAEAIDDHAEPCAPESFFERHNAPVHDLVGPVGRNLIRQGSRAVTEKCAELACETARAVELIDVRARQRERRRPDELLLPLSIVVVEAHRLRRVDLVLRYERTRRQLEDVEPAGDLRAHDHSVVPVS